MSIFLLLAMLNIHLYIRFIKCTKMDLKRCPLQNYLLEQRKKKKELVQENNFKYVNKHLEITCKALFIYLSFYLFRAVPVSYGSFQAKGQIRAAAASLHHSNLGLSHIYDLHHSSQQQSMLDPLTHLARPWIELLSSWILVRFVTADPQWELPFVGIFKTRQISVYQRKNLPYIVRGEMSSIV